jgi:hypothetical protein
MENRILIIGDELFGEQGEVASRVAEMLLCREPSRPMQFSINSPVPLSLPQLLARAASDIIGKKAGRIVLGLGLTDLKKDSGSGFLTAENYTSLVRELVNKTQSGIFVVTVPPDSVPGVSDKAEILNNAIRAFETTFPTRVKVLDFAKHAENFKEKQLERGKFGRSLYTEDGTPTSICNTFMALFLYDFIKKELK